MDEAHIRMSYPDGSGTALFTVDGCMTADLSLATERSPSTTLGTYYPGYLIYRVCVLGYPKHTESVKVFGSVLLRSMYKREAPALTGAQH